MELLIGKFAENGVFTVHTDKENIADDNWVTVFCKDHGPFWVPARAHLEGQGCYICESEGLLGNALQSMIRTRNEMKERS